jgi:hypothetical protein
MKVFISKYRNHWISPYTILERVCFWEKDKDVIYNLDHDPNNKYEKWTDRLLPICQGIQKVLDFIHPKVDHVKIDYWDTWNMDGTLGKIILPMLKQLQETKQGAPFVDDEDVPDELKSTSAPPKENEWDTDDNHFKRWDWVMNEMIFAFERLNDDSWEDNFRSGEIDWKSEPCAWDENGKATMYKQVEGPNHTYECDYDAIAIVNKRMDNGFRLFGKYYRGLWD